MLLLFREEIGYGAARHLELHVVRLDAQDDRVVAFNGDDGTYNAPTGHDSIAVLQARQHFLRLLALALHGKEEQKVEDREDEKDGQESHPAAASGRRCAL